MAQLTEEELEEHTALAVLDERERCMRLCIMRADISRASAKRARDAGTYTAIAFGGRPFFRRVKHVAPRWESRARDYEAVARAFDVVATCISRGYDPRTLSPDPTEKIDLDVWRKAEIGGAHEI